MEAQRCCGPITYLLCLLHSCFVCCCQCDQNLHLHLYRNISIVVPGGGTTPDQAQKGVQGKMG